MLFLRNKSPAEGLMTHKVVRSLKILSISLPTLSMLTCLHCLPPPPPLLSSQLCVGLHPATPQLHSTPSKTITLLSWSLLSRFVKTWTSGSVRMTITWRPFTVRPGRAAPESWSARISSIVGNFRRPKKHLTFMGRSGQGTRRWDHETNAFNSEGFITF